MDHIERSHLRTTPTSTGPPGITPRTPWRGVPADGGTAASARSEDGVDSLVADVFFVVEGADVGGHKCVDAVPESSGGLGERHPGAQPCRRGGVAAVVDAYRFLADRLESTMPCPCPVRALHGVVAGSVTVHRWRAHNDGLLNRQGAHLAEARSCCVVRRRTRSSLLPSLCHRRAPLVSGHRKLPTDGQQVIRRSERSRWWLQGWVCVAIATQPALGGIDGVTSSTRDMGAVRYYLPRKGSLNRAPRLPLMAIDLLRLHRAANGVNGDQMMMRSELRLRACRRARSTTSTVSSTAGSLASR
jgi:hypothetical protein